MKRVTHILPMTFERLDLYRATLGDISDKIYGISVSEKGEITIALKCDIDSYYTLLRKVQNIPFNIKMESVINNKKISDITLSFRALELIDFYYSLAGATIINIHFINKSKIYIIELDDTYIEKYFDMNGEILLYIFNNVIDFKTMVKVYTEVTLNHYTFETIEKFIVKKPVFNYSVNCEASTSSNIDNVIKTLELVLGNDVIIYPIYSEYSAFSNCQVNFKFTINQNSLKNIANYIATL